MCQLTASTMPVVNRLVMLRLRYLLCSDLSSDINPEDYDEGVKKKKKRGPDATKQKHIQKIISREKTNFPGEVMLNSSNCLAHLHNFLLTDAAVFLCTLRAAPHLIER